VCVCGGGGGHVTKITPTSHTICNVLNSLRDDIETCEVDATLATFNFGSSNDVTEAISLFSVPQTTRHK
jgi:hypothetical protein